MPERIASRAALLEIRRDRAVVEEGYRFLDEKRIMLAQELLRRLGQYYQLMQRWTLAEQEAQHALRGAALRHGLEGLQVYPVPATDLQIPRHTLTPFLGISLLADAGSVEQVPAAEPVAPPSNPSREAHACADGHAQLMQQAFALALARSNLMRLRDEYRRTERRVRSLENVIIPEMRAEQREMEDKLDENDQEEVIRSHLFIGRHGREGSNGDSGPSGARGDG